MLLDASNLDLDDVEAKIKDLLASTVNMDSNGQQACEQFGIAFVKVCRLLPGNRRPRYWQPDDFSCDSVSRSGDIVTLLGASNWLSGGDGCDRFRLDVALDKNPLLYSCKFTNSVTGEQVLYVGKTPGGWVVNGP